MPPTSGRHVARVPSLLVGVLCVTQSCAGTTPAPVSGELPAAARSTAAAQAEFPLWKEGAPGALGATPADQPSLTPYLPAAGHANGTAVLIFPGGGYEHLSMEKEGSAVAHWLTGTGVTAFVVRYRLGPRYHHPVMLEDAQRALRVVRSRAAEWNVDPGRVGVIGFSAGGHLAATAGTHFGAGAPSSGDATERVSSRPDFMLLIYPVITMRGSIAHRGSRLNLLGDRPDSSLVTALSNETQVTPETPPAFLVHATDDRTVPVDNSLLFYAALRAASVPVELHLYERGGHGFGLAPSDAALAGWTAAAEGWMRRHRWLPAP